MPMVLWSVLVSHFTGSGFADRDRTEGGSAGSGFTGDVMPRRCPRPPESSPRTAVPPGCEVSPGEGVKIGGMPDTKGS
ncbi:hypothetical protein GCM10010211_15710 [Streptomyces albospinus]|uniref:Secreted protein n=1 Tax=Streptomyces albospinus TaxID=285515 RepID=A0ABQ2UVL8_9ACTN|nr:hypothetical protein GCM10010211_15710 [Streptomyces albospinus]